MSETSSSSKSLAALIQDGSNLERLKVLYDHLTGEETDLERFFQLSPALFCIADDKGYFQKLNYAWTVLTGWDLSELQAPSTFLISSIQKTWRRPERLCP